MPYKKSPMSKSSCIKMYDKKGKQSGLMMEGSAMHMSMLHKESIGQEKKNLMEDMPIDNKASAMEMSPYKMHNKEHLRQVGKDMPLQMGHESPAKQMDERSGERDEFGNIIPEGFTSDAPEVTGTRILSDRNIATRTSYHPKRPEELKAKQKAAKKRLADNEYSESEKQAFNKDLKKSGYVWKQ